MVVLRVYFHAKNSLVSHKKFRSNNIKLTFNKRIRNYRWEYITLTITKYISQRNPKHANDYVFLIRTYRCQNGKN